MNSIIREVKINSKVLLIIALILSVGITAYFTVSLHFILSNDFNSLLQINIHSIIKTIIENKQVLLMFIIIELIIATFLLFFTKNKKNIYYSEQVELTPKIKVPKPVGQGQYGTSWWLDKKDYNSIFGCNIIDRNKKYDTQCFKSGGAIVNVEKKNNIEKYYYIKNNIHLLLVGSSGSGKSRSVIIPTIAMLGLARREYVYFRCKR